ncbi:DUF2737 family protein [Enterobacter sp. Ap-916]|uniref:DUF2737 family protein n=2 Tax=Enterobacter TaxID=547 RepID=UPI00068D606D|nr:DUF2737 family protein [Enterobacter sp. Ag1]NIF57493.1 DUF2737 family protein [Enterobacter sp. Ap-867]NIG28565.1 DUF2737 family protein [Enterobacter sp. Ap-916]
MALALATKEHIMFNHQYNPDMTPGDASALPKCCKAPMPTKAELLARCSFPGVNQNKYLNRMIRSEKCKEQGK